MNNNALRVFTVISLISLASCSRADETPQLKKVTTNNNQEKTKEAPTHNYGGWYCPDNLRGFPAVNLADWKSVPVVNGRLATKEETQTEASLIFIDSEKYPNAKPLGISMPALAYFQSPYSNRKELIIVIQAIEVENDSIVGFRYLNGGNGSAHLNEVQFLSASEVNKHAAGNFFSQTLTINAVAPVVEEVLTYGKALKNDQVDLVLSNSIKKEKRASTFVSYNYPKSGQLTASYADQLFGNFYVQNDYDGLGYTEKFLVIENQDSEGSQLFIVCGPFFEDYEEQKEKLRQWAKKVKDLSEKK